MGGLECQTPESLTSCSRRETGKDTGGELSRWGKTSLQKWGGNLRADGWVVGEADIREQGSLWRTALGFPGWGSAIVGHLQASQ